MTATIAHVGYSGTDDDRDRRLAMEIWLRRNDPHMYRRLRACKSGEQPREDLLDLNSSPARDFLTESVRYDIVVTHNIWGFPGLSSLNDSGSTSCSALHSAAAWGRRLDSAGASYVFMFGHHFNAGSLDGLPDGYECFRVPALAGLSVLADRRLKLSTAARTQTITSRDMTCARLRRLPELRPNEVLDLSFTRLRSEHVAELSKMPRLRNLSLVRTNVSDSDLAQVVQSSGIRTLNLDETSVSDTGIEHVSKLRHLQCLSLNHTRVSDAALRHLETAENLEWLALVDTEIGDTGLQRLQGIRSLRYVSLVNTKVTTSSLEALRSVLPECWTDV